jgi:uncharacterized membrane protein
MATGGLWSGYGPQFDWGRDGLFTLFLPLALGIAPRKYDNIVTTFLLQLSGSH